MCGRFTLHAAPDAIAREFELAQAPLVTPRYNVAPSQPVLAVRLADGARQAVLLRWGLIPHWATDPKIAYKLINARAETVADKPSFRDAFRKRRCLIVADGFYEWQKRGAAKQPYLLGRSDRQLFAFAGLWERWQPPGGEPIESCTIVTTTPNALTEQIHDRMPVILPRSAYAEWLDPARPAGELRKLLAPYPAEAMAAFPVTARVNNPRVDDPLCLAPAE